MFAQQLPYSVDYKAAFELWYADLNLALATVAGIVTPIVGGIIVAVVVAHFLASRKKGKGAP